MCNLNDLNTFTTPFHTTGDRNYLRRVFHISAKRQTRLLRLHDSICSAKKIAKQVFKPNSKTEKNKSTVSNNCGDDDTGGRSTRQRPSATTARLGVSGHISSSGHSGSSAQHISGHNSDISKRDVSKVINTTARLGVSGHSSSSGHSGSSTQHISGGRLVYRMPKSGKNIQCVVTSHTHT